MKKDSTIKKAPAAKAVKSKQPKAVKVEASATPKATKAKAAKTATIKDRLIKAAKQPKAVKVEASATPKATKAAKQSKAVEVPTNASYTLKDIGGVMFEFCPDTNAPLVRGKDGKEGGCPEVCFRRINDKGRYVIAGRVLFGGNNLPLQPNTYTRSFRVSGFSGTKLVMPVSTAKELEAALEAAAAQIVNPRFNTTGKAISVRKTGLNKAQLAATVAMGENRTATLYALHSDFRDKRGIEALPAGARKQAEAALARAKAATEAATAKAAAKHAAAIAATATAKAAGGAS